MFEVIYAGLVNWLVTTIIVEAVIFEDARKWVQRRFAGSKIAYLTTCHLCAGTWVGLGLGILIPGPLPHWFLNGFLYKAVGHLILELAAMAKSLNTILREEIDHEQRSVQAPKNGTGRNGSGVGHDPAGLLEVPELHGR